MVVKSVIEGSFMESMIRGVSGFFVSLFQVTYEIIVFFPEGISKIMSIPFTDTIQVLMNLLVQFIPFYFILVLILAIIRVFSRLLPRNFFRSLHGLSNTRRIVVGDTEGNLVEFKPEKVFVPPEPEYQQREDFFCQMDNDIHPKIEKAYQCEKCLRFVCKSCYEIMKEQGYSNCPYCKSIIVLLSGSRCLSKPLITVKGI